MKIPHLSRILSLIVILVIISTYVIAAVPNTMNYQGRLTNDQGQPVTSTVSMTFTIYDAETGGESKWTEIHPSVTVVDGLFSVVLGQGSPAIPIEDTVFSSPDRWLEITVNGEIITPRTKLSSSSYALQAGWTLVGNVLNTSGQYGISRYDNNLYGQHDSTHVNLGVDGLTGTDGEDYRYCTVGGGRSNRAYRNYSTISGGYSSRTFGQYATVGGGDDNNCDGDYSTIGGGHGNITWQGEGHYATIGGGDRNEAYGQAATIAGGYYNDAYGAMSTIAGGKFNDAVGDSSFVGGGSWNRVDGTNATIGGGFADTTTGDYSTIPGGFLNKATGRFSFAAGRNAKALHDGSFVWADTTDEDFESSGPNQFLVRANGGVGIFSELGIGMGENSRDYFIREIFDTSSIGYEGFITYDGIGIGSLTGTNRQMLILSDGVAAEQVLVFTTSTDHGTTWTPVFTIEQEGQVGINTVNSSVELEVNGDIECISLTETSDVRYKENIEDINDALEAVIQLRGVSYKWRQDEFPEKKFDNDDHLGFIAQEVKKLVPEAVTADEEGYLSVDYSRITPLLVEAMKELRAESDAKDNRIEELQEQVSLLTTQMNAVLEKLK